MVIRTLKILLIVALLPISTPSFAGDEQGQSGEISCIRLLIQMAVGHTHDFVESKGLNLVLKDAHPENDPEQKLGGVFTRRSNKSDSRWTSFLRSPSAAISRMLFDDPGFDLTPMSSAYHHLMKRPVRAITSKVFNRMMEPALPAVLALGIATSAFIFNQIDDGTLDLATNETIENLESLAPELDQELEYDLRYRAVKIMLDKRQITKESAHKLVYLINVHLNTFRATLGLGYEFNPSEIDVNDPLFQIPQFEYIKHIQLYGIPMSRERIPVTGFKSKMTPDQFAQLLTLNYQFMNELDTVKVLLNKGSKNFQILIMDPIIGPIHRRLGTDPYVLELRELEEKKVISPNETQRLIQEDLFWQKTFAELKVLKLQWVKEAVHRPEGTLYWVMTQNEIRTRTLAALKSDKPHAKVSIPTIGWTELYP